MLINEAKTLLLCLSVSQNRVPCDAFSGRSSPRIYMVHARCITVGSLRGLHQKPRQLYHGSRSEITSGSLSQVGDRDRKSAMEIVSRDRRRTVGVAIASLVMSCLMADFNPHLTFPQLAAIAITLVCHTFQLVSTELERMTNQSDAYDLCGPNSTQL